jgi:hypothetical protein
MKFINNRYSILKIIVVIISISIIYLFVNAFFMLFYYGHKSKMEVYNKWVFTDASKKELSKLGDSYISDNDTLTNYRYKGEAFKNNLGQNVLIWKFNDLKNKKINQIAFLKNQDLDFINFDEHEILDKDSDFEIYYEYKLNFINKFQVNLSKSDSSIYMYKGDTYKGVYGKFDKISISNEDGHKILLLNFDKKNYMAVIIFKRFKSIYLAVIHSDFYFSKDIINIFSFKNESNIRVKN